LPNAANAGDHMETRGMNWIPWSKTFGSLRVKAYVCKKKHKQTKTKQNKTKQNKKNGHCAPK